MACLLFRVECFGLLVEVVAAVFGVSYPDFGLLVGHIRGYHSLECTDAECHIDW